MILVLNGYPGVGKLTIGLRLAEVLSGRLLDIHSIYNVAFALTEFKTPPFRDTVTRIEAIAHELVLKRPASEPIILTTVLAGASDWGDEEWERIRALGRARPPFAVVHISCDLSENIRRITSEGRSSSRKPRDPAYAQRNHEEAKPLYGSDETNLLLLDTTEMTPEDAAKDIANWAKAL